MLDAEGWYCCQRHDHQQKPSGPARGHVASSSGFHKQAAQTYLVGADMIFVSGGGSGSRIADAMMTS